MKLLKKFGQNSSKKRVRESLAKYYTSIMDLPVWNWWQLHETNDATHILLDKKDTLCGKAAEAFDLLQEDFVKYFGIEERFKTYMRLKCDIQIAYNKQSLTGDRATTLLIQVMEAKLKEMFSQEKETNYFTAVVAIEKFLGRKVDVRKESTYDVYNYLNELKKWQKVNR